jgi:hypothetical protein
MKILIQRRRSGYQSNQNNRTTRKPIKEQAIQRIETGQAGSVDEYPAWQELKQGYETY